MDDERKLKRLSFIAALFGICVAGQTKKKPKPWGPDERLPDIPAGGGIVVTQQAVIVWGTNDQCPVCGTMAEPFRPTVEELNAISRCAPSGDFSVCRSWTKDDLPKSRKVTCKRCRVRFEQDAEK